MSELCGTGIKVNSTIHYSSPTISLFYLFYSNTLSDHTLTFIPDESMNDHHLLSVNLS